MNDQLKDTAKSKIHKVFSYIRELTKLRTPPPSQLSSYDWILRFSSLPTFPTIQTAQISDLNASEFDGIVLRVKRPAETACPQPTQILKEWIHNGWDKINTEATHVASRNIKDQSNQVTTEKFEDDEERVRTFKLWEEKRKQWQAAEKPVREAALIFSDLFQLQAQLQRESEKYQLYLGDGHLVWESAIEPVDHPILLKKIEIEFDSSVPEFILRETDDSPELYTTLLRHHELDGNGVKESKAQLEETEPHPLANGKTSTYLKFFIQRFFQDGRFYETKNEIQTTGPVIYRDPVIFLGNRSQGFAESLDKLIESLPATESLPEALLRIVGIDEGNGQPVSDLTNSETHTSLNKDADKIDFLLTKPANKEQERVITRLEKNGTVLVQGPPGTGKSHTIANIIGHLLASGKTVLVSSHTSKALRVVREKVVKPLQPLCVSVLENDVESKSQLEESINGIVSYLSRTDKQLLTKEIDQLAQRRDHIKLQLGKLEAKALEIRKNEYSDLVVAGEATPPSEAARKVAEMDNIHGWIPNPVEYGAPIPLSDNEIQELYNTNSLIALEEEQCLKEGLPDLANILRPFELQELSLNLKHIDLDFTNRFKELWLDANQDSKSLEKILNNLSKTMEIFTAHQWIQKVVEDSKLGKERLQPWLNLVDMINSTNKNVAQHAEIILKHGPKIAYINSTEKIKICQDIILHLGSGKSIGFFDLTFKSSWKNFINECFVDSGSPKNIEHFKAILASLEVNQLRSELIRRWERQVVKIGGPVLEEKEPEVHSNSFVSALKLASDWSTSSWKNIELELLHQNFNLRSVHEKSSLSQQTFSHVEQIKLIVENFLLPAVKSRIAWLNLKKLEFVREKTLEILRLNSSKQLNSLAYLHQLTVATENLNLESYSEAFVKYLELNSKTEIYQKRLLLLKKLEPTASRWANAIGLRSGVHASITVPGNPSIAWNISQWKQELDRRIAQDYSSTQNEIQKLKSELNDVNAQYVEKLAWRFQHSRTGLKEKQALHGWQQLQDKITKSGKGKRDVHIKRESRKTLKDCKNAVPVWIMPLSRVFDSFDLVTTKFDVILLDEASQSDISALVAFAIAKQVIVVGDNAQVTPYAVGQELGKIQSLIDELLQGIPNRMLYDGKTSVYDLAEQAFGETIRLVEHFRCVPNIIEFSNQLSYSGEIRPLREASSSPYTNHLIAHRIEGATSNNKTNTKEATEIASIIAAMTEMKAYDNASIGVISMVGQEQAIVIDSLLQRRLATSKYSKHNMLCGNASQFQGDERDIVIISMVDTCDTPPLSIRQSEDFKKTFNVAASRARNQLWVVHSLNPSTDLKPGDLRLRLIQHAENPTALKQAIEATQQKADRKSVVFEPMVIRDLMQNGFRITPQFEVGAYTIDMVVEGATKRIAIECDGDRYHPPEKLADDIQRQMVLERLGWTFIRIRGSEYFRHKEATIKRVISELDNKGIERLGPLNSESTAEQPDDLQRQVLQRAFEIRKEWELDIDPEPDIKPKKGRWGKKLSSENEVNAIFNENLKAKVETEYRSAKNLETKVETIHQKMHSNVESAEKNDKNNLSKQMGIKAIASLLKDKGFEVIDKTPMGGCLWVIDVPHFKELAETLNTDGFHFMFAENGSGSTKDRAAWYSKISKKKNQEK